MTRLLVYIFAALALLEESHAQQFTDLPIAVSYPNISTPCFNALNATLPYCPGVLAVTAQNSNPFLNTTQLTAICTTNCQTALNNARTAIKGNCTASTDHVVFNNISYPATYVVDNLIYTYNLGCRKDKSTGAFCDTLLSQWTNQTNLTAAQTCSDCVLGDDQIQLNSPFGYNAPFAQDFSSLTSSCGATAYAYTSPSAYALNSSATATTSAATATASCSTPYTIQPSDSCLTISASQGVSTFNLLYSNQLDIYCNNFPTSGTICLPTICTTYIVQRTDTCASILSNYTSITSTQFLTWNPNINLLCGNLGYFVGHSICVGPPGGYLTGVVVSTTLAASTPASPAPVPTNAPSQSNSRCGTWYTVQNGDYCDKISVQFGISLKDFYFLNPEINANCTNLLLGLAYCIQAVGDISTYSGYSTSNFITLPPSSFASPSSTPTTTTQTATPVVTPISQLPTASGTISGCYYYQNAVNTSDPNTILNGTIVNSCIFVSGNNQVAVSDLLTWNPSLNSTNCTLTPGYSYCAEKTAPLNATTIQNYCTPVTNVTNGTISTCSCFASIHGYDAGSYGCTDLASDYSITTANLFAWNSWLGSAGDPTCTNNLFLNITAQSTRAVCIGVNATAPTNPASSGIATITSKSTTATTVNSGVPGGPTQSGITSGCKQYYTVVSGDSCASVEAMFAITFSQFYAWNPAIGSNCQSLLIGDAYCVSGPVSTSTSTAPAPTQTGITSKCTQFYTVQSGDSCSKIETMFNITFAQLYSWNPAIGSNCQSLWVGYGVCVAASS